MIHFIDKFPFYNKINKFKKRILGDNIVKVINLLYLDAFKCTIEEMCALPLSAVLL